jgi:hypothetical protein
LKVLFSVPKPFDRFVKVSEKRAWGPNLVHLDAEVFGKKGVCRLCEKFGENFANRSYGKGNRIVSLQGRTSLKKDPVTLKVEAVPSFETYYKTSTDPKEHKLINNRRGDLKPYSFGLIRDKHCL